MIDLLITFAIGLLASILSGMAGGGGGLIIAPAFLLMGWSAPLAIATAKFGGLGLIIGSLAKFRGTNHVQRAYAISLTALAVIAGIIGPLLLLNLEGDTASRLVGLMMFAALPFLFLKKDTGLVRTVTTSLRVSIGYVLYFAVLVLQAAFGGGVGMVLPIIMSSLFGLTMLESAATRRMAALFGSITGVAMFAFFGVISYEHGIVLLISSFIGGWIGTHVALKKGNAFVKWLLCIIIVVVGAKLLLGI